MILAGKFIGKLIKATCAVAEYLALRSQLIDCEGESSEGGCSFPPLRGYS